MHPSHAVVYFLGTNSYKGKHLGLPVTKHWALFKILAWPIKYQKEFLGRAFRIYINFSSNPKNNRMTAVSKWLKNKKLAPSFPEFSFSEPIHELPGLSCILRWQGVVCAPWWRRSYWSQYPELSESISTFTLAPKLWPGKISL